MILSQNNYPKFKNLMVRVKISLPLPPLEKIESMLQKGLKLIQKDFDQKLHKTTDEYKQEMNSMQNTINDLKDIMAGITAEKTQAEKKVKTTKSRYKYVILAIIGSTIIDVILYLTLITIPDLSMEYTIISVLILLGIKITIVLKIIKS